MASDQVETNFLSLSIGGLKNVCNLLTSFPWPFPLLPQVREKAMGTRLAIPDYFQKSIDFSFVFSSDVLSSPK